MTNRTLNVETLTAAEDFARAHHFRLMVVRDGISVEKKTHAKEYTQIVPWESLEWAVANPLIATMERMRAEFE